MRKIAIGLLAPLVMAAITTGGFAQDLGAELVLKQPDCGYVCIYADPVLIWAPEQRQSQLVNPQSETASPASEASTTSDRAVQASRTRAVARSPQ